MDCQKERLKNRLAKRILVRFLCLMLFAAYPVRGQNPGRSEIPVVQPAEQTLKGVVLMGKAPIDKTILSVNLPLPKVLTLKNGLRILVLEHHKAPAFTMRMVFRTGGLSDPANYPGLAQFTANLLREGTRTRTSKEIAEQLDSVSATLSGNSGTSSFISALSATGQPENLDKILVIFSDVIRNPQFPEAEVAKYAARNLSEQEVLGSDPGFLAQQRFVKAIYGNHPASFILPPIESLKKLTSADVLHFYSTYYRPNNAVLFIAGDVTATELLPKLEKMFGDWEGGPVAKSVIPRVPAQRSPRIYLLDRRNKIPICVP